MQLDQSSRHGVHHKIAQGLPIHSVPFPCSLTSQAGSRKQMQLDQSKAWWEEQAANKAAVQAAQKEAEQAYAELTRYLVCVCVCECVCACVCVCVCCI